MKNYYQSGLKLQIFRLFSLKNLGKARFLSNLLETIRNFFKTIAKKHLLRKLNRCFN